MSWTMAFLRRLLLPALVGGYAANLAVYAMLGGEGGASDWRGAGVLAGIVFAGLLVAWPFFAGLRRARWSWPVNLVALMALGTALGALAAYLIALRIVPETATAYIRFGLLVGPVATTLWLLFNRDALQTSRAPLAGD